MLDGESVPEQRDGVDAQAFVSFEKGDGKATTT